MKDKDKQIEEMAVICADCNTTCDECFEAFEKTMTLPIADREEHCQAIKYARRLFNAGYRKLEDSIVLTREEQEKILQATENRINKLKEQLIQARKETAEKFRDKARYLIEERNGMQGYDLEDILVDGVIVDEVLDEIAEEFGVEIKE